MAYKMLDISKHQASFNASVAASKGIRTMICRCAYGTSEDVKWKTFSAATRSAGMELGTYGFLTAHYKSKNGGDYNTARFLMISQVNKWIELAKAAGVNSWFAVDQELEQNCVMGITNKAQNTALLNEACDMISAAGFNPCVYCSASWVSSYIDQNALKYPYWVAYYHSATKATDFTMYSDGTFPATSYGNMMKNMKSLNKLVAWQYGSTGLGRAYGMGSDNLDRNWMYMTTDRGGSMEFVPVSNYQLRVVSAAKPACEVFSAPHIDASLAVLELNKTYKVIGKGSNLTISGMVGTWYTIEYNGGVGYVWAYHDRCVVEEYKMKFIPVNGKQLRTFDGDDAKNCQVFKDTDVNKISDVVPNGNLDHGGVYDVVAVGDSEEIGGMTGVWYIISVKGKEVYCIALPDRCVVEDKPIFPDPEPEPEPTPEPEPEPEPEPTPEEYSIRDLIDMLNDAIEELPTSREHNFAMLKLMECALWLGDDAK